MEFAKSLTVIWCIITYWLGGQTIPKTGKGYIWIRRYVMPIGLYLALLYMQMPAKESLIACVLLAAATHVGYGGSVVRFAISGALMGVPSMIIGTTIEVALLPMLIQTVFGFISLKNNKFDWAYVAILVGASIGIAYTYPVPS